MANPLAALWCAFKGWHAWTPWEYRAAGLCDQERSCGICKRRESRVEHEWDSWILTGSVCEAKRNCKRCPATETGFLHDWGPWCDKELVDCAPDGHGGVRWTWRERRCRRPGCDVVEKADENKTWDSLSGC